MIKNFYLMGDLHGDFNKFKFLIENRIDTSIEESAVIILGDTGFNFFRNKHDNELKEKINSIDIRVYCLRGNHDSRIAAIPTIKFKFDEDVSGDVGYEDKYPNIYYFSDTGSIYNIQGHSILTIPGAFSVDKEYRLMNHWTWYDDEQLNKAEMDNLIHTIDENQHFDYIFAHTCPLSWEYAIQYLFLSQVSQDKVDKSMEKFLDNIIQKCNYNRFYFGHFHDDKDFLWEKATMLYNELIPLGDSLCDYRGKLWEKLFG